MLNSIKKYSKTFFFKVLVGIIILPFLFWGMGDVFSGGSQNVVAKIDSEKVSTRDFVNYLNVLNLSDQERNDLPKTDLIEKILSEYIGKRVMTLEIEKLGITINDDSLRNIIKNDKLFYKNNKPITRGLAILWSNRPILNQRRFRGCKKRGIKIAEARNTPESPPATR